MKTILPSLLFVAFLLNAPCTVLGLDSEKETPPGLKKKGGVPPGLQKKGGVPPGLAKKQGQTTENAEESENESNREPVSQDESANQRHEKSQQDSSTDRRNPVRDAKEVVQDTDQASPADDNGKLTPTRQVSREMRHKQIRLQASIKSINELSKNQQSREAILRRLSRQHRLSEKEVESLRREYPELGLGDLYAANYIAARSKQPMRVITAQHHAGLSWGELATEHRVDLPRLLENSNEIEQTGRRAQPRRS